MIYNLYPKFHVRYGMRGFHLMASDSQMREVVQIQYISFAGLIKKEYTELTNVVQKLSPRCLNYGMASGQHGRTLNLKG